MSLGLVGKKLGMTRIFTETGEARAVTVIEATPNRVTQIKTEQSDGYHAVQVTAGVRRAHRVTKPMQGHFAKSEAQPGRGVWEFRLRQPVAEVAAQLVEKLAAAKTETETENETETETADATTDPLRLGADISVQIFTPGQKVDVAARTIGKGFAGVIKRHGFRGGRATHGNSKAHRSGGSIGNAQDPGRVFKGKKMAGHMGAKQRVQQGLEVVRVDAARNLLLIGGAIPGSKGADVMIRPAVKVKN